MADDRHPNSKQLASADPRRAGSSTATVNVAEARAVLAKLRDEVVYGRDRIEVTSDGCDRVCVIISKQELDALEGALEILSATSEYQSMCRLLSEVAADAGGYA